jgi:hypothetical protein
VEESTRSFPGKKNGKINKIKNIGSDGENQPGGG